MDQSNHKIILYQYLFLAILFAIVTTFVNYSGYGVLNQVEQLPLILRSLDNSFLLNDFYTNVGTGSIARRYYADLIALLAGTESNLPLLSLFLTILSNITISVITFYFARDLFRKSNLAGVYASALVMTIATFSLGYTSIIYQSYLIPGTIAVPLIFAAIWAVARGNLLVGIVFSGISSIIHPLFGLEIGGLLLAAFAGSYLIRRHTPANTFWRALIPSTLVLMAFSLFLIMPHLSQPGLASETFVEIIAYFRHPHHYLPSRFDSQDYLYAFLFLTASIALLYDGRKRQDASITLLIVIIGGLILILCIFGYIFVELMPIRIIVTAQTFRLLYILKWFGLILVAGAISNGKLDKFTSALYLAGVFHPLTMGITVISQSIGELLEQKQIWLSRIVDPIIILLVTLAFLVLLNVSPIQIFLLGFYVLLIITSSALPRNYTRPVFLLALMLAGITMIVIVRFPSPRLSELFNPVGGALKLTIKSELGPWGDEVANFAQQNTPKDSIFLTPPNWGQFRLLSRRAIVVDFKAFPFTDMGMLEWRDRMISSYGDSKAKGFGMLHNLDNNYSEIDDRSLLALGDRYEFSYAVLFSETPTDLEVIFENEKYKIVAVP